MVYQSGDFFSFLGGGEGGASGIAKPQLAIKKTSFSNFSLFIFPFGEQKNMRSDS